MRGGVFTRKQILTASGLNERPIHLIGTSMGGTVVGLYAAQYPDDVDELTLICPCGAYLSPFI
jgi:abhydrolase domain-containing protein 6